MSFDEMDAWIPAFSKIMWYRPYVMSGDAKDTLERLMGFLRRLPSDYTDSPILMLRQPTLFTRWEGVSRNEQALFNSGVYMHVHNGASAMSVAEMEANAKGFMAVFERCEKLGASQWDAAAALKYCMTHGSTIEHQLDIREALTDANLWRSLEIACQLGMPWVAPDSTIIAPVALPDDLTPG